jgi:CBS domain-containing protein
MLHLRDVMTTDVVTVSPETTLRDAMELFGARHVSGAPVVSGGRVVGVVSSTDLMTLAAALPAVPEERPDHAEWGEWDQRDEPDVDDEGEVPAGSYFTELWGDVGTDVAERFEATRGPEWNVLEEHTVSEAMTRAVFALPPHATATEAAAYMQRVRAHRVLVMAGDELVGIVTAMDLAKAIAERRLSTRTYVFDRDADFDERGWE